MRGKVKAAVLGAVVSGAALVPLFGDPRSTPVTHPIWARMLLRAMDMTEAVKASSQASQVFSALAFRDSVAYPADRYLRADGVTVEQQAGVRKVTAKDVAGEVVYPLAVVSGGDYHLRARMTGDPGRPATAEITRIGGGPALKSFTLLADGGPTWVSAGRLHLDPGAYAAAVLLPPGGSLEYLEVAPPCVNAIEPVGGWKSDALTTTADASITALKALDREDELPPADLAIEKTGADFLVEQPNLVAASAEGDAEGRRLGAEEGEGFDRATLRAGSKGLRASVSFDAKEPGLYTVTAFGVPGGGQRWLADSCRKAVLCPGAGPGWRVVLSQTFGAGRHTLSVGLVDGASVERVKIERKKSSSADYEGTLRRIGFDPGPDGSVSRDRALAAAEFVRDRHRDVEARSCGDVSVPEQNFLGVAGANVTAAGEAGAGAGSGSGSGGGSGAGAGGGAGAPGPAGGPPVTPLQPALLPPQQPASPVTPATATGPTP
jgi:hypothetical protein